MTQPTPTQPETLDLEELSALLAACTPGPWHREMIELGREGPLTLGIGAPTAPVCIVNGIVESPRGNRDVNAIVAMRNSFEALLQELAALRGMRRSVNELAVSGLLASEHGERALDEIERLTR